MLKNIIKMNETPFYEDKPENGFRFGDVLRGFISSTPNLSDLLVSAGIADYRIEISMPRYCVVVSPCCSIEGEVISLSPLVEVRNTFFSNPYFEEDLTRINRLVPPDKSVPPDAWKKMPDDEKFKRQNNGMAYTFLEQFIYKDHDIFSEYEVKRKKAPNIFTKFYMIDFRYTFRVICSKIKNPNNVPTEAKCLQLTIGTRQELRDKISHYYGRVPVEDLNDF
jgi:hypothetical protein